MNPEAHDEIEAALSALALLDASLDSDGVQADAIVQLWRQDAGPLIRELVIASGAVLRQLNPHNPKYATALLREQVLATAAEINHPEEN